MCPSLSIMQIRLVQSDMGRHGWPGLFRCAIRSSDGELSATSPHRIPCQDCWRAGRQFPIPRISLMTWISPQWQYWCCIVMAKNSLIGS